MELHWKRPNEVSKNKIWHSFQTRTQGGTSYKVRIEEIPEHRFMEIGEFILKHYINDEPLCVATNIASDFQSLEVFQQIEFSAILPQGISIMAVLDEDIENPPIVGVQLLSVSTKADSPLPQIPTDSLSKMIRIYYDIRKGADPFDIIGDIYLHEWGLCVHSDYRGLGIGFNIVYSLQFVARTFEIPGTMIMFTRKESQTIAEKLGFKLYNEIVYNEYKDENGKVFFNIPDTKSLKFMGRMYL